jgi:hypothetical protein
LARTGDKSIHRPLVTKAPDEPEACRRAGRVIGEAWRRAGQPCCRSGERPCDDLRIHGFAKEGFEAVLDLFADNFASDTSFGLACCMDGYRERVVDLWGGIRNKATREP